MTIASPNDYMAAVKQVVAISKVASRTSVALKATSIFDLAGTPGAGVLAGTNTANGYIPTDSIAGYPVIDAFAGGASGYLTGFEAAWDVAGRLSLWDTILMGGAYSFNSNITASAQPTGLRTDALGTVRDLAAWFECVTAFTGNPTIDFTYTNQDGVDGHGAGAFAFGFTPIVGQMQRLPYQSGDTGAQKINVVHATVASGGTFNIRIMRKLVDVRIPVPGGGVKLNLLDTGMRKVYDTSALFLMATPDSTSSALPSVSAEIASL